MCVGGGGYLVHMLISIYVYNYVFYFFNQLQASLKYIKMGICINGLIECWKCIRFKEPAK